MLKVKQLSCERDQRLLFDQLDFEASSGDIIQVEGANGAGKSTLLKILCGVYDEYGGKVEWHIEEAPLYLGHRPGVTDNLSVAENLHWLAGLHNQSISADTLAYMLDCVGLSGYELASAGNLSEGQRKRVSLARYYGFDNKVWILDEPFSAIDISGVASLESLLEAHSKKGGVALLTSHQPLDLKVPVRTISLADMKASVLLDRSNDASGLL